MNRRGAVTIYLEYFCREKISLVIILKMNDPIELKFGTYALSTHRRARNRLGNYIGKAWGEYRAKSKKKSIYTVFSNTQKRL